jgi:hypothetical protein
MKNKKVMRDHLKIMGEGKLKKCKLFNDFNKIDIHILYNL